MYHINYGATYSVNGNTYTTPTVSQAIDAIAQKGSGRYVVECIASASYSDSFYNLTFSNTTLIVDVIGADFINVFAITVGNSQGVTLYRSKVNSWGNWVKMPTRNEFDTLNSKCVTANSTKTIRFGANPSDQNAYASIRFIESENAWTELIFDANGISLRQTTNGGTSFNVIWTNH